jgi:hypothetical protein
MLSAAVPPPKDDAICRAHLQANVQAAATGDGHPGEWQLHMWALPAGPADLTPHEAADYVEFTELPVPCGLLEWLGSFVGPDSVQLIAQRGLEAGQ